MRILIAVHGYPPSFRGGAEGRAERTARTLAARGHSVRVLCVEGIGRRQHPAWYDDRIEHGVTVRRLRLGAAPSGESFRWGYLHPQVRLETRALVDEWKPDVVHLFSGYLLSATVVEAARSCRVPVVLSLTDYWWLCHRINLLRSDGTRCEGPSPGECARCQAESLRRFRVPALASPPAARLAWRALLRNARASRFLGVPAQIARQDALGSALAGVHAIIAPSNFIKRQHERYGVPSGLIHVQRQGVWPGRAIAARSRGEFHLGYLGQMKPHKGVHLLIDAWRQLQGPKARRLVLYGSAEGEDAYAEQLRRMLDRTASASWERPVGGDSVWQILAKMDAVAVPSRFPENSPNIILEAQAMRVPVVAARVGGIPELVVDNINGLLFEPDDAGGLRDALQRLLDEPGLGERLAAAAPMATSLEIEMAALEDIYAKVCAAPQSRPV